MHPLVSRWRKFVLPQLIPSMTKVINLPNRQNKLNTQQGFTLIELMVGITIGLLVVATATGALMASRGISSTVSEASNLQQQAAYAFRVIGQQIRQAGSIQLDLNPSITQISTNDSNLAMIPVAFDPPDPTGARPPFNRSASSLSGTTDPTLTTGYQNYFEYTTTSSSTSLLRDCLGQNPATSSSGTLVATPVITSKFERKASTNELVCTSTGSNAAQAIIGNVTDMKVRYLEQASNISSMKYLNSNEVTNWSRIYAVEVCLELSGTDKISTSDAKYNNCSGTSTSYGDRMKMVFRNIYQVRSQGNA